MTWTDEAKHLGPWVLGATFLPPFLWAVMGNGNLTIWVLSFVSGLILALLLVAIVLLYRVWEATQITGEMLGEFLDALKEERTQARMQPANHQRTVFSYRKANQP